MNGPIYSLKIDFIDYYIVFGCVIVPCKIIFDRINPNAGKNIKSPAQGFKLISMIGTIVKLII